MDYLRRNLRIENDPIAMKYFDSAVLSDPESLQALHAKAYYLQNHHKVPEALAIL